MSMVAVLREPLLHFAIAGGLIFLAFAWLQEPDTGPPADAIVVTEATAERLAAGFEATWQRPPTRQEMAHILAEHVKETVLVREALRLGLDRDDTVIRRRLRQKMDFLLASAGQAAMPTDTQVQEFYAAHLADYTPPARIAFRQIFLGPSADDDAFAAVLRDIAAGANPAQLGERTMLPSGFGLAPRERIDGNFGTGFFDALHQAPPGEWIGPVRSGFGWHAVRIVERETPGPVPLAQAREAVVADWRNAQAEAFAAEQYARLRARYRVELPPAAADLADPAGATDADDAATAGGGSQR